MWLTDTSDNEDDKVLTNSSGRIVAAKNPATLINYVLTTKAKLFDSRNTRAWARKVREIRPRKIAASYDLDLINSLTGKIDQGELEEVSNFVNLFTDLITTTKEDRLERLRKKREVVAIWEYYYKYAFWPRFNDPKKFKNFKVRPYKTDQKLLSTLKRMTKEFVQRIEMVD